MQGVFFFWEYQENAHTISFLERDLLFWVKERIIEKSEFYEIYVKRRKRKK